MNAGVQHVRITGVGHQVVRHSPRQARRQAISSSQAL
jgi:hypothetical protein